MLGLRRCALHARNGASHPGHRPQKNAARRGQSPCLSVRLRLLSRSELFPLRDLQSAGNAGEFYTNINTNLLFFTKGTPTKAVWYYEHQLPEGYKNYTKTRPIKIEYFADEKAWWDDREENAFAWKVPLAEIEASGYNLDISNPHVEEEALGDPDELLARYRRLQDEIAETRDALKAELTEALR